jgi:hypothetical protein
MNVFFKQLLAVAVGTLSLQAAAVPSVPAVYPRVAEIGATRCDLRSIMHSIASKLAELEIKVV